MAAPSSFNPQQALGEAVALHRQGRLDEAEKVYNRVLKGRRDHFDALHLLGMLNHQRGKAGEAYRLITAALKVNPRSPDALSNLALVLHALKRDGEALANIDKALALAPDHVDAHNNHGNRGRVLGRELDAVAAYDQALSAMPGHVSSWMNRGLAFAALNRHQDALSSYGRALALQPDHADTHFNEALSLLTVGDYVRGFQKYEWRWKRTGANARPRFRQPPWLGEYSLANKTILIHAEQGLGDTIQFARYAPRLARAGAKVMLEVQPELKTLLSSIDGVSSVIARGEALSPFDAHCPVASMPLACRTSLANVPDDIPYLRAGDERVAKWRPRLEPVAQPRVALVWAGRAAHVNDRNRSIALAEFEPLLASGGVRFVSVQRELRPADAERLAGDSRILHVGDDLSDFAETAAVLTLCDLVICVDTSVAHLAGALGRPTFVLVPFQPDWRWTANRATSPWYPQIRLFRQPVPGDWKSAIRHVSEALASLGPPAT